MKEELKLCPGCFLEAWSGGACSRCGNALDPDAFPTALQPGTVVSRYTLGRVLGKPGGFGITYLAFDPVLNRRVAIKELMPRELVARRPDGETLRVQTREDEALFAHTLSSFLNEARVIAQFSHPNVVRVLDFFEANGTAYFAMEYYEGETLAEYTQRAGGRIAGEEAVAVMLPLLDALEHIHSLDPPVLHRDIKPSNIYLTGRRTPILLDFGAARVALGQQSRSLSAVLTPGFAPWEQYSTRGNQGPWTDVYGCAATLYFLVTGRAPPEASSRVEDPTIEPPQRLVPALSPVISDAIVRGLAFRTTDRPQSAREFAALLTGRAAATILGAGAAALAGGALAGGALAAGAVGAAAGLRDQETVAPGTGWSAGSDWSAARETGDAATMLATSLPASARARRRTRMWTALGVAAALGLASAAYALTRSGGDPAEPDTVAATDSLAADSTGADSARAETPAPDTVAADEHVTPGPPAQALVAAPPTASPSAAPPSTEAPQRAAEPAPTPRPESPPAAPPTAEAASGVLVIVYGDEPRGAQQAESAVLRSLVGRQGLRALDASSLSMIRGDQSAVEAANRGDFSALASLGRQHGAEFLVVGNLSSQAAPSVGRFFTGTAQMEMKMYRVSTGRLVDASTFRVGTGGTQAVLANTEGEARSRAAEQAGNVAAAAARSWLARAYR